ncbi:TniB protein [Palleronia aestuarii]|uniref:TniB protein n=1 Tax=Palleronia aestuarii TaxID=568105 RepID=A0A2W7MTT9_9RHOB|nr:TniB family NTP-binding protein [Palleronia aestuarii]PZX10953.1 TniB protein [Palleronia aestuarii]
MSDAHLQLIGEQIADLQAHFVRHEGFRRLEEDFRLLRHRREADIKAGRSREVRGIAVIGASGSGKTTAVDRLLRNAASVVKADPDHRAIISLRVPSPATVKYVGQTILRGLGYPVNGRRESWYVWNLVRYQLKERQTLFLHLDEAQDLAAKGTERERQSVVNLLKSLMQDPDWPICLVLSGTGELADILNFDPQLGRRFQPIRFEPISELADLAKVRDLLSAYIGKTVLAVDPDIESDAFGTRLVHAAANEFGLVIEIAIAAIEVALLRRATTLTVADFAGAFRRRAGCIDGLNPFVAENFRRIDPRELLAEEDRIR